MQYAKDQIRQRIIDVAREEFLEKGFEKGLDKNHYSTGEDCKKQFV